MLVFDRVKYCRNKSLNLYLLVAIIIDVGEGASGIYANGASATIPAGCCVKRRRAQVARSVLQCDSLSC